VTEPGEGTPKRPRASSLRLPAAAAALLGLSGCTLSPTSNHAAETQTLYNITFAIAAVIFVVVGGLIVVAAVRFRHKRGDDDTLPKQVHGNTKLEIVWIAVPTLIVLVLFILSSLTLGKIDSAEANSMTINVTGFQWEWKFTYPDFKTSDGTPLALTGVSGPLDAQPGAAKSEWPTLGLELNQPVHFHLEAQDVIHSFFIPSWLFKRDVIPGHPNDFWMTPDKAGTFVGKCAELCGLYHSGMLFNVQVMPKAQFDRWIQTELDAFQKSLNACRTPQNGTLTVVAKSIQFDAKCIQVPAAGTTKLVLDNQDPGTPHNIEVYTDSAATQRLAGATGPTNTITGVSSTTYIIQGLQAGTFYFKCDVHPGMNGKFVVK
jgi:cytochrome c oxidase subunit II